MIYQGVKKDTRSKKEKDKDFDAKSKLVSSMPRDVLFRKVKEISEIRSGIVRDQLYSSACVEHAIGKGIELALYLLRSTMKNSGISKKNIDLVVSAIDYQFRNNKPQPGCIPVERVEFKRKNGWYWEKDVPSNGKGENYLETFQIARNILRENGYDLYYYVDNNPTFEETAQYVYNFWNALALIDSDAVGYLKDIPTPTKRNSEIRHEICFADAVTYQKQEVLAADESYGIKGDSELAKRGQRLITKDAFDKMVEQVIFIKLSKRNTKGVDYSKYINLKSVNYGYKDYGENVYKLQNMLKEANFLDNSDTANYEDNGRKYYLFGKDTRYALKQWQLENIKDVSPALLKAWNGHYFGPASIRAIKNLANNKVNGGEPPENTNMKKEIKFKWQKFLLIAGSAALSYLGVALLEIDWGQEWQVIASSLATGIVSFVFQAIKKEYFNLKG